MVKKKTEDTINLDAILFKCRDILRAARNSGSFFEKRDMMLTLVFLRFIGEKYEDGVEKLRQTLLDQGLDPDDENIRAAFFDDATFADGTYNLPPEARWSTIINTPAPKLNVALDNALHSIAAGFKQLKGCFVEGTFTTRNLAANDIKKLIDEVNKISHKQFGEEKDLIGRVYEYFLKEFAVNATKEEGEFYTPHDAVQLIATMIEPYDGTPYSSTVPPQTSSWSRVVLSFSGSNTSVPPSRTVTPTAPLPPLLSMTVSLPVAVWPPTFKLYSLRLCPSKSSVRVLLTYMPSGSISFASSLTV